MTLHGRTVLVTGGTGGIGKETARRLARLGARVVLVGRDPGRARSAVEEIRRDTGNGAVAAIAADLTRQRDVRRLAGELTDRYDALHVLVNNAGIVAARRELTEDGVETAFAANVLAPFMLTHLLLPLLRASAPARVVNVTGGIPRGRIDLDNLQGERSYVGLSRYNQTKLALMAMSYAFAERVAGTGVTINVAYPGHAYTSMNRGLASTAYPALARPVVPLLKLLMPALYGGRAVAEASKSTAHLVSSPDVAGMHGTYVDSRSRPTSWPTSVLDERNRAAVWQMCRRLGPVDDALWPDREGGSAG